MSTVPVASAATAPKKAGKSKKKSKNGSKKGPKKTEYVVKGKARGAYTTLPNTFPAGRNAPDLSIPKQINLESNVEMNTRNNVFAVLEPCGALKHGILGKVCDSTFRPTFSFASRGVVTWSQQSNLAAAPEASLMFEIYPYGLARFAQATTYAGGLPTVWTTSDDPSYSQWSSFVDKIRMVSCEVKIRQISTVTAIGGSVVMARCGRNDGIRYGSATMANLISSMDSSTHTLGKPGDVFKTIWLPLMRSASSTDTVCSDWTFKIPANAGTDEDTILVCALEGPIANLNTFQIEFYTHWEALVKPTANQVYTNIIMISDATLGSRLLAHALSVQPVGSQTRNVEEDDGIAENLAADVKSVFGAGKKLFGTAKTAWSWVKGLFGEHQYSTDFLEHLLTQGAQLDQIQKLPELLKDLDEMKWVDPTVSPPPTKEGQFLAKLRHLIAVRNERERVVARAEALGITKAQIIEDYDLVREAREPLSDRRRDVTPSIGSANGVFCSPIPMGVIAPLRTTVR